MFQKKNTELEEQIMQDITDEQLSQVTGGSLTGEAFNVLGVTTSTVTGLVNSVSVSGIQVNAAGASVSTPAISTSGLVSGLL
ncbi:MAG TPA: hypothetical protein VF458_08855 [Ktedonobacteraceae bacterium]